MPSRPVACGHHSSMLSVVEQRWSQLRELFAYGRLQRNSHPLRRFRGYVEPQEIPVFTDCIVYELNRSFLFRNRQNRKNFVCALASLTVRREATCIA